MQLSYRLQELSATEHVMSKDKICLLMQCSVPDAIQKCRHDWMKDAIRAWVKSIDREDLLCNSAPIAL